MNEDQPYFPQAVTLEEAWVRARNTWTLAQRHGTLEEGDVMAVGELRRHVKLIDEGGVPLDVVNKAINAAVADASNGARQTAEYWKAEHLAGNDRIAMLETSNAHFTERIIELEADLAAAQARIERYEALLNRCSDACKVVPVLVRNGEHISLPTHIEKAIGKDRHEG